MNLSLSKRADYVIKAAIALARTYDGDSFLKLRQIAGEMAIPRSYTPQILDALIQNGLVESRAGKAGGYRLTKPPETITVLTVLEAGEGPLKSEKCALSDGPCRWESVCPMHELMATAIQNFREAINGEFLSELASRDLLLERGELPDPEEPHLRRDPFREFPVVASVEFEKTRLNLLSTISQQEGEWLSTLMVKAIESALGKTGLEYLIARVPLIDQRMNVNLGVAHERGAFIEIPVTFESDKRAFRLPQLVGNISLLSLDTNRTKLEVSGRVDFNPVIFSGSYLLSPDKEKTLHGELEILAKTMHECFVELLANTINSKNSPELTGAQTEAI